VEEFEGDARPAAFGVQRGEVGEGTGRAGSPRDPVEAGVQGLVGEGLDLGPVQAGPAGALDDARHGAQAHVEALGHLAVANPQQPLLAEDLADLTHG